MFPTSGYFKSLQCPFYNESTCNRPNCHFKHQKHSINDRYGTPAAYSSKKLAPHCPSIDASTASGTDSKYVPYSKPKSSAYRSATLPKPHYQHAPFPTGPSTLVYKPTPISELNKIHAASAAPDDIDTKDSAQAAAVDAVINAEFQVIGQFESEVSSPSSTNLKDDESAITPTDKEISLDVTEQAPSISDDTETSLSLYAKTDSKSLSNHANSQTEPKCEEQVEIDNSEKRAEEEREQVTSSKHRVTKVVYEEFLDMFGEASDDEVIDEVSLPTTSRAENLEHTVSNTNSRSSSFIDLTGGSSSSDEDIYLLQLPDLDKTPPKVRDATPVQAKSSKHLKSNPAVKEAVKTKKNHPIIVSSEGDSDQCKELFAMFQHTPEAMSGAQSKKTKVVAVSTPEISRKRQAREGAEDHARHPVKKRRAVSSAQQVLHERYEKLKQADLKRQCLEKSSSSSLPSNGAKPDYNNIPNATVSRTYKGQGRVAHQTKSITAKKSLARPRISPASKSKVAVGVRQQKLDMLVDECLKLYSDESEAFSRAKSEEEAACARSTSRVIYINVMANVIRKIRDEVGSTGSTKPSLKVSHEEVISGKAASSFTVGLKRRTSNIATKEDMCGDLLFKKLRSYILTEAQLVEHGFPQADSTKPGHAIIKWSHYDKLPQIKNNIRTCRRCGKHFGLRENGEYIKKEECIYHWGKAFQKRVHGSVDMHFSCCDGKPGTEGCTICVGHVHDTNKFEDLTGYMKTFAKNEDDYCGIFALDCEMVYTMKGIEVARITVINDKLSVVLDSVIKPSSEIIDYNTRFSGLTSENFEDVDTSLKEVQAILLNMFQEDTVLIGHSLNSDLVALKLIHNTVVDTSVVWPHKNGLPYKRALKNLMLEILNQLIQESGSAGHDSSEDASACMKLMKWKVFQDYLKDHR